MKRNRQTNPYQLMQSSLYQYYKFGSELKGVVQISPENFPQQTIAVILSM